MDMRETEESIDSHTTIRLDRTTHNRLKELKPDMMTYDGFINTLINDLEGVNLSIEFNSSET